MYVRTKTFKNKDGSTRTYLYLVESVYNKGKVTQKNVACMGRVEDVQSSGLIDRLMESLSAYANQTKVEQKAQKVFPEIARDYGLTLLFRRLWKEGGLEATLKKYLEGGKEQYDVLEAIYSMILNRLSAPSSKRATAEWYREDVHGGAEAGLDLQHYYRAMDLLLANKDSIEHHQYLKVRDLFHLDVTVVFVDTTMISFYTEVDRADPFRTLGHVKNGRHGDPQVVIGLLLSKEGYPIGHEVYPGSLTDAKALPRMLTAIQERFSIKKAILVGDRGMVSKDNLKALEDEGIDYIVGMRMRKVKEVKEDVLGRGGRYSSVKENLEVKEVKVEDRRYVVCLNPLQQDHDWRKRQDVIEKLWEIVDQNKNVKELIHHREYKKYLTITEAKTKVNLKKAEEEERYDGKWVLLTNTDLPTDEVALQYKQLWQVERCFRDLKSDFEIQPAFHWTERRIRAHIFLCVLALQLKWQFKVKFREAYPEESPERALKDLSRLQSVTLNDNGTRYTCRTDLQGEAHKAFKAIGMRPPNRVIEA